MVSIAKTVIGGATRAGGGTSHGNSEAIERLLLDNGRKAQLQGRLTALSRCAAWSAVPTGAERAAATSLEQMPGYDELLNLAGSVKDAKSPDVSIQTFHGGAFDDTHATKDLQRLIHDFLRDLRGIELGN